jgi:hypothetical protein
MGNAVGAAIAQKGKSGRKTFNGVMAGGHEVSGRAKHPPQRYGLSKSVIGDGRLRRAVQSAQ